MKAQVRELKPGDAFLWRGKRYVLEGPSTVPNHVVAYQGKQLELFLEGQVVEFIVPEAEGQLGLFS